MSHGGAGAFRGGDPRADSPGRRGGLRLAADEPGGAGEGRPPGPVPALRLAPAGHRAAGVLLPDHHPDLPADRPDPHGLPGRGRGAAAVLFLLYNQAAAPDLRGHARHHPDRGNVPAGGPAVPRRDRGPGPQLQPHDRGAGKGLPDHQGLRPEGGGRPQAGGPHQDHLPALRAPARPGPVHRQPGVHAGARARRRPWSCCSPTCAASPAFPSRCCPARWWRP